MVVIGRFFARCADKRLGEDLQGNLVRLFAERSAQVVQNDEIEYSRPRSFDYAVATVATPDLDLRFVRVREQFEVEISGPAHTANGTHLTRRLPG
jgi:hypothetical protein